MAHDVWIVLTEFFTRYPQYQHNEFYVTGESYAGKYVPAISYEIYHQNAKGAKPGINLTGE